MSVSPMTDPAAMGAPDVDGFIVTAYEAHHAEMFAVLARSTRDRGLAEELLETTFARLTREARAGRPPRDVRRWLLRVAASVIVERSSRPSLARRWFGINGRAQGGGVQAGSATGGAPDPDRTDEMEPVLAGLSVDARLALLLSAAGLTGDEIADAVNRSSKQTRSLLWRARARVRIRRDLFAEEAR